MSELVRGDAAPDFRLKDSQGSWVSFSDFPNRKLVLYFYPQALTPGCTVEAIDFSQYTPKFRDAGYTIIGVSPDEPETLATFIAKHNLTITLLADPDLVTIKEYGAWGERMLWGKTFTGLLRSTFVLEIDAQGKGTVVDAQYSIRATGHVERLAKSLGIYDPSARDA
ncbi:MAG: peroxiredoxin [Propionibacteriaceae bacterium]|nr:peroxiredoxin [Propionibacteriaceae bacterium]